MIKAYDGVQGFLLILLSLFTLVVSAQSIGEVVKIPIQSKILNQDREILVYTPDYYQESTMQYFDLVIVFDSQNRELFDLTHAMLALLEEGRTDKPFIVVGVAAYTGKEDYARNDDFLPPPQKDKITSRLYGYGLANRAGFTRYIQEEVIPLLQRKYRISSTRLAVGHSLGGSYVLSTMVNHPTLFSDYIVLSPNLQYDEDRLANAVITAPYKSWEKKKFLFLAHAKEDHWKGWKQAREKVYDFLSTSPLDKLDFTIKSYEEITHRISFVPAVYEGLRAYVKYRDSLPEPTYEVNITVTVPKSSDEVYITGNQKALGDWAEGELIMKRVDELTRTITLSLKNKAELRFTNGKENGNKVADIEGYDLPWLFFVPVSTEFVRAPTFKILSWSEDTF